MNDKLYLDNMTKEQLTRVYNACQPVREGMFDYCLDMLRDMIFGELKYHFRDCIDVTEDAWSNIGIVVNDPVDFIEKLATADSWNYGIDDQKTKDIHADLVSKINDYKTASENDDSEKDIAFCAWYIDHVNRVAYALRSYCQDMLDKAYSDEHNIDVFIGLAMESMTVTIGTTDAEASDFYIIGDNYGTLYRDAVIEYK